MKTIIVILASLVILTSNSLLASNPSPDKGIFQSNLVVAQNNLVVLRCLNTEDNLISIQIEDSNHDLLNTKVIRKKGVLKVSYSLDHLPAGTYYFEVYQNHELVKRHKIEKQNVDHFKIIL